MLKYKLDIVQKLSEKGYNPRKIRNDRILAEKAGIMFPERSNTPGTAYVSYRKDGTFDQYIVFDANRMPVYRIDYGMHRGKKTLHIHYYKNGNALPNPPDLKKGDPLYEKHKRLFKGVK